jgi:hypothetical protein
MDFYLTTSASTFPRIKITWLPYDHRYLLITRPIIITNIFNTTIKTATPLFHYHHHLNHLMMCQMVDYSTS